MPATFWTGSNLSFINGNKTVTVNTGSPLSSIRPNSSLTTSNYNEPVEIESAVGNTITLYSPWPGSTGDFAATITPSAATVAAAGQAAQEVVQEIKALIGSASVNVTANSFAKRDANGRIKTATPVNDEDAVNKGYLGEAATRRVQESSTDTTEGRIPAYRAVGGIFGLGSTSFTDDDLSEPNFNSTRMFLGNSAVPSDWDSSLGSYPMGMHFFRSAVVKAMMAIGWSASGPGELGFRTADGSGNYSKPWNRCYHTGNTNFNEFGGQAGVLIAVGFAISTEQAVFQLYTQSKLQALSITIPAGSTFKVTNAALSQIKAGIPAADISLTGIRSGKVTTILAINLSNLTVGQPLYIYATDASSKIKVNF